MARTLVAVLLIGAFGLMLILLAGTSPAADTRPRVCVSAVGPVDQYGQGDTTAELRCEP